MNLTSLISDNYKTIECSYDRTSVNPLTPVRGEKMYTYKAPLDMDLQVGDAVIVNPPQGFKVVIVTKIHDAPQINPDARYEYKWIVSKVDQTQYQTRMTNEALVREKLARLKRLQRVRDELMSLGITEDELEDMKQLLEV